MTSDFFSNFAVSPEEAEAALVATDRSYQARDGRICSCGHPVSKHSTISSTGETSCKPGLLLCKCEYLYPVIEVPNTRYFMRKSLGNGADHALMLGIAAANKANPFPEVEMVFLIEGRCQFCQKEAKVAPAHSTKSKIIMHEPTTHNVMLCEDCIKG